MKDTIKSIKDAQPGVSVDLMKDLNRVGALNFLRLDQMEML
jgi:hypothetical protein